MDNKEIFNPIEQDEASLCEGGGTANGGDGGSEHETPSISRPPQGESQSPRQEKTECWYIDLTAEEFAAYCVQLNELRGAMRHRKLLMGISGVLCGALVAFSLVEWLAFHLPFDWITSACGLLMLLPMTIWALLPRMTRKKAIARHKASVAAGMVFTGQLIVTPEFVEKVGPSATAHIQLDGHTLFFENKQMMVFQTAGSPALILPGRCLTPEQAAVIRRAADALPTPNRRFIARVRCGGQRVAPATATAPEKVWTTTFTYTADEFATVMKGGVMRRFWKLAPWITLAACFGSFVFGWGGTQTIPYCIGYFLMFMGVFLVMNLAMPLLRIRGAAAAASPHDLTIKVTFDTVALRMESTKGVSNWVLWSDVTHVYDKGDYAEVVLGTASTLMIPKRAIEDIPAFEMALELCRGKK